MPRGWCEWKEILQKLSEQNLWKIHQFLQISYSSGANWRFQGLWKLPKCRPTENVPKTTELYQKLTKN